ncbi:MAG: hypothetical protein A3J65_02670 [Candidatus Buchananbacteria bacterium RIFCSPHIGHO2_02_FULL_45_11b]|uniref:Uncharacterized protein n=4 Tax=Candidatus Buchananiibacteriota TaxID=1817903 RepID=A0A1G1YEL1_9BACT|nr:MAG: hypothetical protein A2663_00740 [Candidatus Buchananbacteria bacterium RIFCSPHIGHO2_01_FULL_46_12]OGY50782.1 MAG: hypothetical protein A3J65_02670 [Candidatus Buchananbacteria bacterium RIFCSPHIGHO2_02_FULL_45_11b]OGY52830.1 MAG: hypothetical protein A3B15_00885 [Candidatus Buchananbacteria bacterium RIFCSPLOWO2_01_FULL_45_31]OGY56455.1 MAG: hypothetical protein A3H67_05310 [Candidatus Buchananbacteria bacterium RIFCSPLOWO2_02_FULL_46_11b]
MNYLKYFFDPGHLFSLRPPVMQPRAIIILTLAFGILIALGLILKFRLPNIRDRLKNKGYGRLIHLCFTFGLIGFVYLFFAWQGVALLSSRFWLVIMGLTLLVWLFFIGKYFILTIPKLRKEIEEKRKFSRYIP